MRENLVNEVKAAIERKTGSTVTVRNVTKGNGVELTGVIIMAGKDTVSPIIYIDDWLEISSVADKIADEVIRAYESAKADNNQITEFMNNLDRESILERVEYRLINAELNRKLTEEAPHRDILDLSIFYRCVMGGKDGCQMSMLVNNRIMKRFRISADELEAAAAKNAKKQGAACHKISDLLPGLCGDESGIGSGDAGLFPMYVLTNSSRMDGAWTLTDGSLVGNLADSIGDDLYLLPSSIHEIIAVPVKMCGKNLASLKMMVRDINTREVIPGERLGESVYLWDREKRELRIAA